MSSSGISFSGIGTGIDTAGIIDKLMKLEATQQTAIKIRQTKSQNLLAGFQSMNTKFLAVRTAAEGLNLGSYWKLNKSLSSDETSVKATADATATPGSISFSVKNLASSQIMASFGTVASLDTVVGTGQFLVGAAGGLGFGNITSNGLATGARTLEVTQASAGGKVKGAALADSIVTDGTEVLNYQVTTAGVVSTKTLTLTAGTYTQASLAKMVQEKSGGQLTVGVNSDRSLTLQSTREGSSNVLRVNSGTALAKLGMTANAQGTGVDGIVKLDGVVTTVKDINPGVTTATFNSTTGNMTATLTGGLRVGTETLQAVDLGDGKLSTVVAALNNANAGLTAQAVQIAPGQYKLQLSATETGSAGALSMTTNKFSATLGRLDTVAAAQDATLVFGSGASAYEAKSSSNRVTGVVQGVALDLVTADPSKLITITTSGDGDKLADKVGKLVEAFNSAVGFINDNSKFNQATKVGGPLIGDLMSSTLQRSLVQGFSNQVDGSTLGSMSAVGITLGRDGQLTFDKAKFAAAYGKDPEAVAKLFVSGGTQGVSDPTKPGIAERLIAVAKQATDSVNGAITSRIKSTNNVIDDYTKQIDGWDLKLELRRKNLQRQFGAMETAVSRFQNQGNWLSGQLASLSGSSSR